MTTPEPLVPHTLEKRTVQRITRRLMPYLTLLFIIAYIDRVNVGYAAVDLSKDLGFDTAVFGFGAGIFFIGYFLLEIPGSLIVEKCSARKWLARIIISWGLLATLMGFIHTATHFYLTESAAAACIGLINSIGNLGGFAGPYIVGYLVNRTGSFYAGIIYLSAAALTAALLVLAVQRPPRLADRAE